MVQSTVSFAENFLTQLLSGRLYQEGYALLLGLLAVFTVSVVLSNVLALFLTILISTIAKIWCLAENTEVEIELK
jgi:hypothetical protein